MYICAWYSVGFGAVFHPEWVVDDLWVSLWKRNVNLLVESLKASKPRYSLLVLSYPNGVYGYAQTFEVKLLESEAFGIGPCSEGKTSPCYHVMLVGLFLRGMTPLMEAISDARDIDLDANPKERDRWNRHWALIDGMIEAVDRDHHGGVPSRVGYIDPWGYTALHRAARRGAPYSTIKALVESGEDVNQRAWDSDEHVKGITPLFLAVKHGHVVTLEALIAVGAKETLTFRDKSLIQYAESQLKVAQMKAAKDSTMEALVPKLSNIVESLRRRSTIARRPSGSKRFE